MTKFQNGKPNYVGFYAATKKISLILFFYTVSLPCFSLSVATWNLHWLSDKKDPIHPQRTQADYQKMADIIRKLNADIIALQEIDNLTTLRKVVSADEYHLYLSQRAQFYTHSEQSQQFTAWAIRKNFTVIDHNDVEQLALASFFQAPRLRYGTYLEIKSDNLPPIHLLSIHLKAGCYDSIKHNTHDCNALLEQTLLLKNWIEEKNKYQQSFIIAGDFNHYLTPKNNNASASNMWQLLNDDGNNQLINLTEKIKAKCKVRRYNNQTEKSEFVIYHQLIDHIIASSNLIETLSQVKSSQIRYPYADIAQYQLSDHCPLITNF